MVGNIFEENNEITITGNVVDGSSTNAQNTRQYIEDDLTTLIIHFTSYDSPYTDLQKEEEFKKYKGKLLKGNEIVMEVKEVMLSSNLVIATINPVNQYLRGATIYFDASQKDKLLQLDKYDEINFEGRVEDYGSLMGIIIKDAKFLN